MFVNSDNKYSSPAEYFYNPYIAMYCIIGTTISIEYLDELFDLFESADLLTEVPIPDCITGPDYDCPAW